MNSTVTYYRINANNTNIAQSNSGAGVPTEQITAPVAAGTYASGSGTNTIVNQTSGAFNTLSVGQYLYYIDLSGNYVLMGQIASFANANTEAVLTSSTVNVGFPPTGATLAGSYSLITTTEAIYIRIATDLTSSPTQVIIPNFRLWRTSADNANGLNNQSIITLEQISNVGTPASTAATITPVQFTIRTMNNFVYGTGSSASRAWPNTTDFPTYMWIRVTPSNGTTIAPLASKTLYRWTTQETFDGIPVSANSITVSQLQGYGYNVTGGTTATSTTTTGG